MRIGYGYFIDEDEYENTKTCPECGGTGKDNDTLNCSCYLCNGRKRISNKEYDQYYNRRTEV